MTWTRRRWLSAFALATLAAALRGRRAGAAARTTAATAKPAAKSRPATAERVEYKTRWIGHY